MPPAIDRSSPPGYHIASLLVKAIAGEALIPDLQRGHLGLGELLVKPTLPFGSVLSSYGHPTWLDKQEGSHGSHALRILVVVMPVGRTYFRLDIAAAWWGPHSLWAGVDFSIWGESKCGKVLSQ